MILECPIIVSSTSSHPHLSHIIDDSDNDFMWIFIESYEYWVVHHRYDGEEERVVADCLGKESLGMKGKKRDDK